MIININPYDTGFDENAHVMRFAALAREITTNLPGSLPQTTQPRIFSFPPPLNTASRAPSRIDTSKPLQSSTRKLMLSIGGNSKDGRSSLVDTVVDIVEGKLNVLTQTLYFLILSHPFTFRGCGHGCGYGRRV
jgi:hypothetical protein